MTSLEVNAVLDESGPQYEEIWTWYEQLQGIYKSKVQPKMTGQLKIKK